MKEQEKTAVEEKSPTERVSEILDKAAEEIKQIIAETVTKVKVFPKTRLGKLDDPNFIYRKGTVENLPGIWINLNDHDHHRPDADPPFILTKKGLKRSSFYFCDSHDGYSRPFPVINRLEEPTDKEYLKWGHKALWALEDELERQKGKNDREKIG